MMYPIVSAAAATGMALLFIVLTVRVSILRQSEDVSLGTGGSDRLERAVRAQGNFVESAPLVLLLLILLEITGGAGSWIPALAAAYFGARLVHAVGLSFAVDLLRALGAIGTLLVVLTAAVLLAIRLTGLLT